MKEGLFVAAVQGLIDSTVENTYKIALGTFISYTNPEDGGLFRFCDLSIKPFETIDSTTASGGILQLRGVPILKMGTQRSIVDDQQLIAGDTLLVLFSDKSIDEFKDSAVPIPNYVAKRETRNTVSNAMCIPISTHEQVVFKPAVPSLSRYEISTGQLMQIGAGLSVPGATALTRVDLVEIISQLLEILSVPDSLGGIHTNPSTKGNTIAQLKTLISTIEAP